MNFFTIVFIAFLVFMVVQRIWETFFKVRRKPGRISNKWSLNILIAIHSLIVITMIVEYFIVRKEINFYVSFVGLMIFSIGLIGRNWAINTLGIYHSPHLEIREEHLLIKHGPYEYLRHPYYLSVVFEFLGFPLIPNSYYAFCLSLFLYIPVLFILRVYPEEKVMMKEFGSEYQLYKKEVYGVLPLKKNQRNLLVKKLDNETYR